MVGLLTGTSSTSLDRVLAVSAHDDMSPPSVWTLRCAHHCVLSREAATHNSLI